MSDNAIEALAVTPPASVLGLTLMGFTLSEWVVILNAIYILVVLVYKMLEIYRKERNGGKQPDA